MQIENSLLFIGAGEEMGEKMGGPNFENSFQVGPNLVCHPSLALSNK